MTTAKEQHDISGTCPETNRLEKFLPKAKALIFDCDGTLLDTMPIYFESWSRTCKDVNLSFPLERFYSYAGRTVHDIFQTLIKEQLPEDTAITADYCEALKRKHHADIEKEGRYAGRIDVVVDIAFRYYKKVPLAVASSGWRDHVISGLEQVGILHLFNAVVTACDAEVKNPKPAPDIFRVAAKRIGVDPMDCIGFEDADLGMMALQGAGYLYCCDVRLLHMYPRNVEMRLSRESSRDDDDGGLKTRGKSNISSITLSILTLGLILAPTTSALSSQTRRGWVTKGIGTFLFHTINPPKSNAIDTLPSNIRQYTALAPLGTPKPTGSKVTNLPLTEIASRLTNDLINGTKNQGGYFLTGDLSTELFRDDCTFIDPTNSVSSLSKYQNALRILFDPKLSTVQLVEPLVVDEMTRTIRGRVRSSGVLQLPWHPRIASYETVIVYSIDEKGLIYRQEQEWSISASQALQQTFTPSFLNPPYSNIPRDETEPLQVTELFNLINGHRPNDYPISTRFRIAELIEDIVNSKYAWIREDLGGKWALVYLQPGPDGSGIDRRIPFVDFWFNDNYQIFGRDTVMNVGEVLGPLLEVRVSGTLEEGDASLATPKRFKANIKKGGLCFGRSNNACIPLPISGEGLFDGVYLGKRLRIGQNLNGGGARVVQVKIA